MRCYLIICSFFFNLLSVLCFAQTTDTSKTSARSYKPEIFTNGFIDIVNNGQINASARFIRIMIGEPEKIAIPLSLYSGVSANNFQNNNPLFSSPKSNDQLITSFINPLSGLINLSIDGVIFFRRNASVTKTGLLYHAGERVLTGYFSGAANDIRTGKPVNFLNSYASTGLYFQTGAWERNNSSDLGIFWIAFRYHFTHTNPDLLKDFLPDIRTNGLYSGYSLAFGVEINYLINLKAIYYRYIKKPELDYSLPIYQFSFNYSLRN